MKHFAVAFILSIAMITPIFALDGDIFLSSVPKEYRGSYYCAAVSHNGGINWEYFNWKKDSAFCILMEDRIMFKSGGQSKFTDIVKRNDTDPNVERMILVQPDDTACMFTKLPDSKINYYFLQVFTVSDDCETMRFMLVKK